MSYRKLSTHPLRSLLRRSLAHTAVGALGVAAPLAALANPSGGQVVAGSASIGSAGANGVVVNQGSQRAVINWQQFNVGANQYVQFVQPNSSAVVLNRVVGSNASNIFGNIIANGQVFLVNPNGVYFAPGASIDVQGLVATTLDLSDSDFMQGKYAFHKAPGAPDATVVNQGAIHAGNGGYVVLAGDYVENDGSIDAQSGRVALAAAGSATLTLDQNQLVSYVVNGATLARLAGVDNAGSITAEGGGVLMTADVANALTATAVNNSGLVAAHSVRSAGGEIVLLAQGGDIDNSGTLDASAVDSGVAGGTVILRGDGLTRLDPGSVINTAGDGAAGGYVELSGHTLDVRGAVNPGRGGNLLIDPSSLNIVPGNTGPGTTGNIGVGYIQNQLNSGVDVVLVASNAIGHAGSVTSLTATGAAAGNLTVKTGTLAVGAGGSLANVSSAFGGCANTGLCQPGSSIVFTATSGSINLSGMNITIKGAFVADADTGNVNLSTVTADGGISLTGAHITAGSLIAVSGNVAITGTRQATASTNINETGLIKGKSVSIQENLGSASYGGSINVGNVQATAGSIAISAAALTGVRMNIHTIDLTATKAVKVKQEGGTGGISFNNVTAGADASSLGVSMQTVLVGLTPNGGSITGGSITATGGVQLQANAGIGSGANVRVTNVSGQYINLGATAKRDADISTGILTATGGGTGSKNISLSAHATGGASSSGGRINVTGSISAAHGSVSLYAQGGLDSGGHINVTGPIDAAGNVSVVAVGSGSCCDGTVNAGNITASNIFVSVSAKGSGGASLTVGNLKAGSISLDAVNHSSGSAAITAGNIIASQLRVDASANRASGQAAHISLGSISAVSATKQAVVVVNAEGKADTISIGKVNVSGHALASFGEVGPQPIGAVFQVTTHGGSSDSINIGGNVSVSALTDAHGTLGDAVVTIGAFAGASSAAPVANAPVTVGGNLTVNAARDAQLFIHGSVSGAAAITAGRNINEVAPGLAINAGGVTLKAGNNINLASGSITVGSGAAPGVAGDHVVTNLFGLGSIAPNAAFIAGGSLSLGALRGSASYVLFGVGSIGTLGTVALRSGAVVQLTTAANGNTLGAGAAGQSKYTAADINKFTGDNVVIGGSALTGALNVGAVNFGSGSITLIDKGTIKSSGTLTAGNLTLLAGAGAVTLTTDVGQTTVLGGSKIGIDDTAFTGSATLSVASGKVGSLSYAFGGSGALGQNLAVTGALTLTAAGTLDLSSFAVKSGTDMTLQAGKQLVLANANLTAGNLIATTGGSIDLSGATATVTANMQLVANKDVILSGVDLKVGALLVSASGSIHNGGTIGTIDAGTLIMKAGTNIDLSSTDITIGSGVLLDSHGVPVEPGDPTLLAGLRLVGLAPAAIAPNGLFQAAGSLTLGKLTLTGSYLYLQASSISILGPVSVPAGAVIQAAPVNSAASMGIEDTGSNGSDFDLSNDTFLSLFPGATLVIGNSAETGPAAIGQNGQLDIGDSNLIIATSGAITGLENVVSTGLVTSLESLLGSAVPPPTPSEIDPNSPNNNNTAGNNKKHGDISGEDITGTGEGGTISQDTDPSSVCH